MTSTATATATPRRPSPASQADGEVLASAPALAGVLEAVARADRLVAEVIDGLIDLQDHDVAEIATHVPLEQWLAIVGRRTRADRRMLLTTCDVLRRLPSLRAAFCSTGDVSWSQTRTIVLQVHRLPRHLDARLDAGIAQAIDACTGADPDDLSSRVGWVIADLVDCHAPSDGGTDDGADFFAMQPRLDGTGGRVWGEFGPLGFATLDAALATGPIGDARDGDFARAADPDRSTGTAASAGQARARRLIDICDDHLAEGSSGRSGVGSRVQLLVRADLDTLLDRDRTPAALLTHLLGGRMWIDAATARRLIDARGADLRTVVLDDTGRTVGVGRRRRIAPGWLKDATLAVHDTCTAPGCLTAARICDLDHARPWHPARRRDRPGTTDADQLAPLCRTDNRTKEAAGWTVEQHPDGTRTWRHTFSGLTTRTHPTTRPPGHTPRAGPATRTGPATRAGPDTQRHGGAEAPRRSAPP